MRSRRSLSRAAVTGVVAATLIAACSNPTPEPTPTTTSTPTTSRTPSPTPSPTPSVDPTVDATEAAILQAYRGYWDAMVRILANPDPFDDANKPLWNELEQYAVDKAESDLFATAYQLSDSGIAMKGEPVLDPSVSDIVIDTSATVTDCVDSSDWQPVSAATGESAAAPGQAIRVTASSTLIYYDDRWVVNSYTPNREQTC